MAQHSTLGPADGIHKPYSFEFADASARASATNPVTSSAYTSADVGKIALQTDDGSIWRLTATTPTWAKVAQQSDVDTVNTALTTHTGNTSNPHSVTASQIGPLNAGEVTTISPSNYTPSAATLAGNLDGIDTALASAGATPGGSNKFVQYNSSGSFGGDTNFQIDTQTGKLTAPITESGHVSLVEQASAPAQPSSGFGALYAKNDSKLYYQDDSGTETELTASGGATAAGSANQIQYNDGNNAFAASAAKVSAAGAVDLPEITAPSTPSSGFATVFAKADGTVNVKTDGGEEHRISPKQVDGVLVSPNQDGAEMLRVPGRSAASGAGPSFDGGTGTDANQYCFLMLVTPYQVLGPGANQSSFTTTRGYFMMSGGTGGQTGKYGGLTKRVGSSLGWNYYRTTNSNAGTSTAFADQDTAWCEAGPSIVGQSQLTFGVSSFYNLTAIGPGFQARMTKTTMQENQMAQVDIGMGLGEAIIHSVGSVDCSSGNPFTSPIHFKLCQRIWLKEGEFRDIASSEVESLGAVTFYRRWIPSGISVSSGTTVDGWAEAGGNTGSNMTVQGGAAPVKLTIDWGAR